MIGFRNQPVIATAVLTTIESGWPRAQVVIRDDYRDVVGTPGGKGQVDQFLALLSWVAS